MKSPWRTFSLLAALTALGVLIAGYHPGAEDDGIYLAAIQHDLNPKLFLIDSDFFALKLKATLFDTLIAAAVRITHVPVAVMALTWHLLTIFAILAACYRIASRCFEHEYARWCGMALVTVFFTLPVSGTALYIVDQNLVPRAVAAALALFAVDFVLGQRYVPASALIIVAFLFHPVIAAFGLSLCFFLAVPWPLPGLGRATPLLAAFIIPVGIFDQGSISPALHTAIKMHGYCSLATWAWYEWLGAIAPIFLLLWFAHLARQQAPANRQTMLKHLALRTAAYGVFQFVVALLIMLPPSLERLRVLEPMRYLHLLYVVMILLIGCFLGEKVLRQHHWRWVALFLPAALGMFLAQRALYPASSHLEFSGIHSSNPWLQSFEWIRNNTPEDAYFALGPDYMHRPGEDSHGFRALALRSALADNVKDSGMVMTSPLLAVRWQREVAAQNFGHEGWQHVSANDLRRLKAEFGVDWTILERPVAETLDCPYQNNLLAVCRIN